MNERHIKTVDSHVPQARLTYHSLLGLSPQGPCLQCIMVSPAIKLMRSESVFLIPHYLNSTAQ